MAKPKRRASKKLGLEFDTLLRVVRGVGEKGDFTSYGIELLPDEEVSWLRKSEWEAGRRLALKNVGYTSSKAQLGQRNQPFDSARFSLLTWKYLGAIRDEILRAVEDNDLGYFIRLGRLCSKLKRRPSDLALYGNPLAKFLIDHWLHDVRPRPPGSPPPFCMMTPAVLEEVCKWHAKSGAENLTMPRIEKAIRDLGLRRAKSIKLGNCGFTEEEILLVAPSATALRRAGVLHPKV